MEKLIFDGFIGFFCALAAYELAQCYAESGNRMYLVFAFMCLVCVALVIFSVLNMIGR